MIIIVAVIITPEFGYPFNLLWLLFNELFIDGNGDVWLCVNFNLILSLLLFRSNSDSDASDQLKNYSTFHF